MGVQYSGSKMSTGEYAARKFIDVVAAIAVPVAGYFAITRGPEIVDNLKTKLNKIKHSRQK